MTEDHRARGGAAVAVLNRMEPWESNLVLNLRLWCEGTRGQSEVWNEYRKALPGPQAQTACRAFEVLLKTLVENAHRPLVRRDVGCNCVGADEAIFVHLVHTASDGHLGDAALIATLIIGPSKAEHIAVLAGEVGTCVRDIHAHHQPPKETLSNVVRLH